jgi:hypothetical protein
VKVVVMSFKVGVAGKGLFMAFGIAATESTIVEDGANCRCGRIRTYRVRPVECVTGLLTEEV